MKGRQERRKKRVETNKHNFPIQTTTATHKGEESSIIAKPKKARFERLLHPYPVIIPAQKYSENDAGPHSAAEGGPVARTLRPRLQRQAQSRNQESVRKTVFAVSVQKTKSIEQSAAELEGVQVKLESAAESI